MCALLLHSYYNKQWAEAQRMISDLSPLDVSPEEAKPEQVCMAKNGLHLLMHRTIGLTGYIGSLTLTLTLTLTLAY